MSSSNCFTEWQVDASSKMQIQGETNVNQFTCSSIDYKGVDTIREYCDAQGVHFLEGEVRMSAKGFDCQHPVMSRDFRKTLEAEKFPEIKVAFLTLEEDLNAPRGTVFSGDVAITLAGVTRTYPLTCKVLRDRNQRFVMGEKVLRFSDFEMDRPSKFFGAVKVKDEVTVDFVLRLEEADQTAGIKKGRR